MFVLDYIAMGIAIVGSAIVFWGISVTAVRFVLVEARGLRDRSTCQKRESIRHQLGSYLLLGLEFLIAADVIRTIRDPSLEEVAILAAIVVIRTVISFFLNREMADLEA